MAGTYRISQYFTTNAQVEQVNDKHDREIITALRARINACDNMEDQYRFTEAWRNGSVLDPGTNTTAMFNPGLGIEHRKFDRKYFNIGLDDKRPEENMSGYRNQYYEPEKYRDILKGLDWSSMKKDDPLYQVVGVSFDAVSDASNREQMRMTHPQMHVNVVTKVLVVSGVVVLWLLGMLIYGFIG